MAVHDSASAQHENKLLAHPVLIPRDAEIPLLITEETRRLHHCCPQLWIRFVKQTQGLGEGPHCVPVPAKPTVLTARARPTAAGNRSAGTLLAPRGRHRAGPSAAETQQRQLCLLRPCQRPLPLRPEPGACTSDRDTIGRVP